MDMHSFVNSKVLFKKLRKNFRKYPVPSMVHINYHPEKRDRLRAARDYYLYGNAHNIQKFPDGSM